MVQYFCLKVRQFSIGVNVIAVNAFQGRVNWMMLLGWYKHKAGLGQDDTFWVGVGSE